MKKNGQYVGVDEKFIPEDEKYVDESLLGNKEKSKKIIKNVGIGYLIFVAMVLIFVGGMFIFIISRFIKMSNMADNILDNAPGYIENVIDQVGQSQNGDQSNKNQQAISTKLFNGPFEIYAGSKSKMMVSNFIDSVFANNNKATRVITVKFEGREIKDNNELKTISSNLTKDTYYISFEYDEVGYIKTAIIE